jgi:hypothetical protein
MKLSFQIISFFSIMRTGAACISAWAALSI